MIKSSRNEYPEDDFDFESRVISAEESEEDRDAEVSLRPKTLTEYVGQEKVKEKLAISMEAAKMRGDTLDHILLHGPPGLGKTTLASIANYQRAAYTAGTYYTDTLCTFGVNYGDAPFKACIVGNANTTGQDAIGSTPCQIVFDKPIQKDNKTAFVLTVRRSWSRA